MRVGFQRQQTLLVTTERGLWRYDKALLFTNQSEVGFGTSHVIRKVLQSETWKSERWASPLVQEKKHQEEKARDKKQQEQQKQHNNNNNNNNSAIPVIGRCLTLR